MRKRGAREREREGMRKRMSEKLEDKYTRRERGERDTVRVQ